jgi:hypothetical protein
MSEQKSKVGKIVCTKCGKTADQLLMLGLAIAFGARTNDPSICIDGKEHDFKEIPHA